MKTIFHAGIGALLAVTSLDAQTTVQAEMAGRTRVTLAIALSGPLSSLTEPIIRRQDGSRGDIIILPHNATPEQLLRNIKLLLQVHRDDGIATERDYDVRLRVRSTRGTLGSIAESPDSAKGAKKVPAEFKRAERTLERLKTASVRTVDGLGEARAVDIYIPKPAAKKYGRGSNGTD